MKLCFSVFVCLFVCLIHVRIVSRLLVHVYVHCRQQRCHICSISSPPHLGNLCILHLLWLTMWHSSVQNNTQKSEWSSSSVISAQCQHLTESGHTLNRSICYGWMRHLWTILSSVIQRDHSLKAKNTKATLGNVSTLGTCPLCKVTKAKIRSYPTV